MTNATVLDAPRTHPVATDNAKYLTLDSTPDLTADRIEARSKDLNNHNREAVVLAARALEAMRSASRNSTPLIRGHQTDKYRRLQLDGTRSLPFEEFVSIAVENQLGAEVMLAGLRVLAAAIGFELVPVGDVPAIGVNEALATLTLASADLEAAVTLRRPQAEIETKARTTMAAVRMFTSQRVKDRMEFYRRTKEAR